MNEQMEKFNRELETIEKNQIAILELKSTISEMKKFTIFNKILKTEEERVKLNKNLNKKHQFEDQEGKIFEKLSKASLTWRTIARHLTYMRFNF